MSPIDSEMADFFNKLNACKKKSTILRVIPKHCEQFKPSIDDNEKFPTLLSNFYVQENEHLSLQRLLELSENIKKEMKITEFQIQNVEAETKEQSNSKQWFRFRIGRITASIAKSVCATNPDNPSLSLLSGICYRKEFRSIATNWGIENENNAKSKYTSLMNIEHDNFNLYNSGLIISQKYPFIGASPDGIINCLCCGQGCLEIKYPYKFKDRLIEDIINDPAGYLMADENNKPYLNPTHGYMYQVQTQLLVTGLSFCDFFVWTNKDSIKIRIEPDLEIIETICKKLKKLFVKAILPELLGKFYSNKKK